MKRRSTTGFTLTELLLALALTAVVATGALVALDSFVDADRRATQKMEETIGIGRALQMVRRDVGEASALDVAGNTWVVTRRNGTAVGYAIAVGGTELHRFEAATPALATSLAQAAASAVVPTVNHSPRGHLKDSDYRDAAILQGVQRITGTAVERSGSTLGVNVVVQSRSNQDTQCVAVSLPLLETYGKSTSGSGSGSTGTSLPSGSSGGGLLGGLSDLLSGFSGDTTSGGDTSSGGKTSPKKGSKK